MAIGLPTGASAFPHHDGNEPEKWGDTVKADSGSSIPVPTLLTDVGMDLLGLGNLQLLVPVTPQSAFGITGSVVDTELWGTSYSGRGIGIVGELASSPAPADPYIVKSGWTYDQIEGNNAGSSAHASFRVWVVDLLAGRRWTFNGGNVLCLAFGARLFDFRRAEFTYTVAGESDLKLRFPVRRALLPALEFSIGRGPG